MLVDVERVGGLWAPGGDERLRAVMVADEVVAWEGVVSGRRFGVREGIGELVVAEGLAPLNERYQALYDGMAGTYDLFAVMMAQGLFANERVVRERSLSRLVVPAGGTGFEVGVGTGRNRRYVRADSFYYGVDLSWPMLRRCRRNWGEWEVDGWLGQARAEGLPFGSGVFEVVFEVASFNFFADKGGALAEMGRVLQPGGLMLVVDETPTAHWDGGWRQAESFEDPRDYWPESVVLAGDEVILEGAFHCFWGRKRHD
ncbi:MAG TPA: class I SAM-dependent methyltransferase [Anaerolineae bacterium]|nr:class I SAM-dependent methyltransferase [Anaerolineae bacterium]